MVNHPQGNVRNVKFKLFVHYVWSLVLVLAICVTVLLSVIYVKDSIEKGTYKLYSHVQELDTCNMKSITLKISGTFTKKGEPLKDKIIHIVLDDGSGNKIGNVITSDRMGSFTDTIFCNEYKYQDSLEVVIVSAFDETWEFERYYLINEKTTSARPTKVGLQFPILILIFFVLSFVVPFSSIKPSWKFLFSIFFAFVFSLGMIFTVAFSLHYLNRTCEDYDNLTLGFASVFYDKYVIEDSNEWILSFNSINLNEDGTVKGFGAPLWVLFLSVIGSGLYTISIIGTAIKNRPNLKELDKNFMEEPDLYVMSEDYMSLEEEASNEEKLKERKHLHEFRIFHNDIIRHQLYILFSPIASIFVYQIIISTGAGANGIVVGLAALGSGLTFNIILNRAITLAQESVSPKNSYKLQNQEDDEDPNNLDGG